MDRCALCHGPHMAPQAFEGIAVCVGWIGQTVARLDVPPDCRCQCHINKYVAHDPHTTIRPCCPRAMLGGSPEHLYRLDGPGEVF